MSGIQGLSSDQQQVYNQLINDAGTVNVSRAAVDKELQVAMDAGLSFQEAAAQVRNDLPTLTAEKFFRSTRRLGGRGLPDGEHQCPHYGNERRTAQGKP